MKKKNQNKYHLHTHTHAYIWITRAPVNELISRFPRNLFANSVSLSLLFLFILTSKFVLLRRKKKFKRNNRSIVVLIEKKNTWHQVNIIYSGFEWFSFWKFYTIVPPIASQRNQNKFISNFHFSPRHSWIYPICEPCTHTQ